MWRKGLSSVLPSNAQLVLRKAIVVFSIKLSVQQCAAISTREAECEAELVGFQMWNVSVLMHE